MDGHGYCSLGASPPPAAAASGRARRSLELTNTKETKAWEGLAIGAVTLARTVSTGSHRFCRSGSERRSIRRSRSRSRSGLPGALRRAFSLRRHPAGGAGAGDGYWRIHDMDGDSDDRGDDTVEEEAAEEEAEAVGKEKHQQQADGDAAKAQAEEEEAAAGNAAMRKKKRGGILKACKKLLRL